MANLILIRHAETKRVAGVNAHDWQLTDEGQQRCIMLAEKMQQFGLQAIFSSPEPKAIQTARPIADRFGIPLTTLEGLREHDRRNVQYVGDDADFRDTIKRLFEQPDQLIYGNETANQAYDRFYTAVHEAIAQQPDRNLALVSHATVLTLFISRMTGSDPYSFWSQLGMPAYIVVDPHDWKLLELVAII